MVLLLTVASYLVAATFFAACLAAILLNEGQRHARREARAEAQESRRLYPESSYANEGVSTLLTRSERKAGE